jgi:pimeloyl-ACP methyl ester carboxylesterase
MTGSTILAYKTVAVSIRFVAATWKENAMHSGSGYAEINGARLHYEVAGVGRPLILLHEGIANLHFWDDQWEPLAREYRVVRYDLRGFGQSVIPLAPFNMRADLAGLMDFLGIESAILMGASIGGSIIVDFALEYPARVDALIPVAAGLSGATPDVNAIPPALARLWMEMEDAEKAGDRDRADALSLRIWVDGPNRAPDAVDPVVRERVRQMLRDNRAAEVAEPPPPIRLEPPAIGRLSAIRVPTLVIVGDADVPAILDNAAHIARGIPGARKAVMPNTAHALNMERPDEFNRIVLDFLHEVAPAS